MLCIYIFLFICFEIKQLQFHSYTYIEKTLIQNQESGFLNILPKTINIQLVCIIFRNIFEKKNNRKLLIIIVSFVVIFTLITGDRASILSFIIVWIYFYMKNKTYFSFKRFLIKAIICSIFIYFIFTLIQSFRNKGSFSYKWQYDTFDTYLLALHYYKDKSLDANSFLKIFINLVPRSIYPEKGILLGKVLKLISIGAPFEDYKLYGSTALNFQGEVFLNFRYLGALIIFIMGILCKKIEKIGENRQFYWEVINAICISYFFLIVRGDLVSQATKLILSLVLFNLIYMSVYILELIIKSWRNKNNKKRVQS